MRKIFLDIGTHNGQTLDIAVKRYPDFDMFIGIEPVVELCERAIGLMSRHKHKNIKIFNIALDALDCPRKNVIFYEDTTRGNHKLGSSLLADKTMRTNKKIEVQCMDVNFFFNTYFQTGDKVTMKIDVEGKEYDIFDALIGSGNLKRYVTKIYSEWHWNKVPSISKERHNEVLVALNELGYNLKGRSKDDEFYDGF